jgi:hypothetical protein
MKIGISRREGQDMVRHAQVNSFKDLHKVFDGELLKHDPTNYRYTIVLSDKYGTVTLIGYTFHFEPKEEKVNNV